jgi:hypothetical protein
MGESVTPIHAPACERRVINQCEQRKLWPTLRQSHKLKLLERKAVKDPFNQPACSGPECGFHATRDTKEAPRQIGLFDNFDSVCRVLEEIRR